MSKINTEEIKRIFENYEPVGEKGFNHFAVLVPVIKGDSEALLYEVRAKKLDRQPGEICFPGGLIEPGESPLECALRETEEEVGISAENIEIAGKLDSVYSTRGSQIHCFVGLVNEKGTSEIRPSRAEVEEAFTVAVDKLMECEPEMYYNNLVQEIDPDFPYDKVTGGEMYPWAAGRSPVPVYDVDGRIIWGLTGRITKQFIEILKSSR